MSEQELVEKPEGEEEQPQEEKTVEQKRIEELEYEKSLMAQRVEDLDKEKENYKTALQNAREGKTEKPDEGSDSPDQIVQRVSEVFEKKQAEKFIEAELTSRYSNEVERQAVLKAYKERIKPSGTDEESIRQAIDLAEYAVRSSVKRVKPDAYGSSSASPRSRGADMSPKEQEPTSQEIEMARLLRFKDVATYRKYLAKTGKK